MGSHDLTKLTVTARDEEKCWLPEQRSAAGILGNYGIML